MVHSKAVGYGRSELPGKHKMCILYYSLLLFNYPLEDALTKQGHNSVSLNNIK